HNRAFQSDRAEAGGYFESLTSVFLQSLRGKNPDGLAPSGEHPLPPIELGRGAAARHCRCGRFVAPEDPGRSRDGVGSNRSEAGQRKRPRSSGPSCLRRHDKERGESGSSRSPDPKDNEISLTSTPSK